MTEDGASELNVPCDLVHVLSTSCCWIGIFTLAHGNCLFCMETCCCWIGIFALAHGNRLFCMETKYTDVFFSYMKARGHPSAFLTSNTAFNIMCTLSRV